MTAGSRLRMISIRSNIDRSIFAVIILYLFEVSHSLYIKALES